MNQSQKEKYPLKISFKEEFKKYHINTQKNIKINDIQKGGLDKFDIGIYFIKLIKNLFGTEIQSDIITETINKLSNLIFQTSNIIMILMVSGIIYGKIYKKITLKHLQTTLSAYLFFLIYAQLKPKNSNQKPSELFLKFFEIINSMLVKLRQQTIGYSPQERIDQLQQKLEALPSTTSPKNSPSREKIEEKIQQEKLALRQHRKLSKIWLKIKFGLKKKIKLKGGKYKSYKTKIPKIKSYKKKSQKYQKYKYNPNNLNNQNGGSKDIYIIFETSFKFLISTLGILKNELLDILMITVHSSIKLIQGGQDPIKVLKNWIKNIFIPCLLGLIIFVLFHTSEGKEFRDQSYQNLKQKLGYQDYH